MRRKGKKRRHLKTLTQRGKSNRRYDKKRKALHPGVRISASGRRYTERRRNRSDKNRSTRL